MKYLIFNLKSKLNYQDLQAYCHGLEKVKDDLIIAPGFLYLDYFKQQNFQIAAQDVSAYPMGNFTGEVNATQLKSIGCQYVLIGHYERRQYLKENCHIIITKVKEALKNNLKVILCFSYSIEIIKKEIKEIFSSLSKNDLHNIIIAYEPAEMIGSNKEIEISKLRQNLSEIKNFIKEFYQIEIEIIYGGSVNLNNLNNLKTLDVEGFLIGDVSTQLDDVLTFIKQLKQ